MVDSVDKFGKVVVYNIGEKILVLEVIEWFCEVVVNGLVVGVLNKDDYLKKLFELIKEWIKFFEIGI